MNKAGREFDDVPVIDEEGTKRWFIFNRGISLPERLHRVGGPAVLHKDGSELWYQHGELHREDGPAVEIKEKKNSESLWYRHGQLHREGGPAIEAPNGDKVWYLCNKEVSEELHGKLTGPVEFLPLLIGQGFDDFIAERLRGV